MKKILVICLALLCLQATAFSQGKKSKKKPVKKEEKSNIQVAVLLDTSNSMDGLIDQAKSQLWKMVNELALAKDNHDNIPNLEIALYEYGNDNLSKGEGFIRMVSELTTDLDLISEKLFGLTTNGGSEYCGQVIQKATNELKWNDSNDDLKIIFIAGNEPFTQGPVDYEKSCKKSVSKGIIVNTIFCGREKEGINGKWKSGASLADGKFMSIDHNEKVVHIDAPQDKKIAELSEELNKTYIGYGSLGQERIELQKRQDSNASQYGRANTATRAMSKASNKYKNEAWDLVDATKEKKVVVEEMEAEELPEEMKEMDKKERKEYVEKKSKDRERIQKEIKQLNKERQEYVSKERAKQAKDKGKTLDDAIIKTIREQAEKKDYCFDEE